MPPPRCKPKAQRAAAVTPRTGDIAAWLDEWTLKAITPDGVALDMNGTYSDIMKRLPNGNWVNLVDNPYGAAAVGNLPKDGL
jgi:ketosteroid isomerase-like protein